MPGSEQVPDGFGIRLSGRAHRCDDGRTLMGGEGASVLRLSARAAVIVDTLPAALHDPEARSLARILLDRGLAEPWWNRPAGPDTQVGDVTVVVPVRDRVKEVAALLPALPPGVPVIVVDDGSADPSALRAVAAEHGARLLRHRTNRGPAAARNTGLAAVRTPFVAFVDSDVAPVPGWLTLLRRHFDDPALAVVAPRVLGPAPRDDDGWLDRYEQARSSLDLGADPAPVRVHGRVAYLPSACLVARAAALGAGFDEQMRVGEDVDLVWRLLGDGWRVRYEPGAVVRHRHRTTLVPWLRRKAFYGTSAAPLGRRHGDAVSPMVVAPWTVGLVVAVLAQRRWSVPAAAGVYAAATLRTAARLRDSDRPLAAAAVLTAEGAVATAWQTASSMTRHHWPLALAAAVVSRRARRALLVAALAEGVADHHQHGPRLDPVRYVVAHRLDDLAYGSGVWWGALRERSLVALLPRGTGWPRRPRSAPQR